MGNVVAGTWGKSSIFLVSVEFWITCSPRRSFVLSLPLPMVATSLEVPFVPGQKLRLSKKAVRHSDSESSTEGKGLRENSVCVHTLMV